MLRLFAHTPERVLPAPTAKLSEAHWPVPFRQGLEYSPPTRGPWTIVHVGMLVPECHEIFVCAQGCLRGVVLSAAELGLQRRFSTITVTEEHLRDGQLEDTIIEGVTHILERLPKLPPSGLPTFPRAACLWRAPSRPSAPRATSRALHTRRASRSSSSRA